MTYFLSKNGVLFLEQYQRISNYSTPYPLSSSTAIITCFDLRLWLLGGVNTFADTGAVAENDDWTAAWTVGGNFSALPFCSDSTFSVFRCRKLVWRRASARSCFTHQKSHSVTSQTGKCTSWNACNNRFVSFWLTALKISISLQPSAVIWFVTTSL